MRRRRNPQKATRRPPPPAVQQRESDAEVVDEEEKESDEGAIRPTMIHHICEPVAWEVPFGGGVRGCIFCVQCILSMETEGYRPTNVKPVFDRNYLAGRQCAACNRGVQIPSAEDEAIETDEATEGTRKAEQDATSSDHVDDRVLLPFEVVEIPIAADGMTQAAPYRWCSLY